MTTDGLFAFPPCQKERTNERIDGDTARKLFFGRGNAKLDEAIFTFSLPAGHACPFAKACWSKANRDTGTIKDGPHTTFRCYAASMEVRPSVRRSRWRNLQALRACKTQDETVNLILNSLSRFAGYVRIHDSGDFYSQRYFNSWLNVAQVRHQTVFYFYTKSIAFWVARLELVGDGHTAGAVANFIPTASWGGKDDRLIEEFGLRSARVVLSESEAEELVLAIDHDDSLAACHGPDFSLLIHGSQPAGTPAAKAVAALRAQGEYGYGERAAAIRASRLLRAKAQ